MAAHSMMEAAIGLGDSGRLDLAEGGISVPVRRQRPSPFVATPPTSGQPIHPSSGRLVQSNSSRIASPAEVSQALAAARTRAA